MSEWLLYFLAAALIENLVLTTGFGSSLILRMARRPRDLLTFGGAMTVFAVLTVLVAYPLDALIGSSLEARLLRPIIIVLVDTNWYLLAVLAGKKWLPKLYHRIEVWLPMAAYNNVVVGVALIVNYQFKVGLLGAIGLAMGAGVGFTLLSLLVAEAREHLDHSDLPHAFRGLPVMLLWLGIIALALMGFSPSVSFI